MASHGVMWCNCRERNSLNFEDCERMVVELKDMRITSIRLWCKPILLQPLIRV
jgi:hypothetical protein